MGSVKRDGGVAVRKVVSGGFVCRIGGLRKSLPLNGVISMWGARCEEALNALLAMRFSLQRMAAAYQLFGSSSKGQPDVRHMT